MPSLQTPRPARDYSPTLNLPKTDFPMRADLPRRESEMLARFDEMDLYGQMQARGEGKPTFILHDGPPFSNGKVHMGTALNKILKDFIVKYKSMTGFRAPYVPGWDNHGMPIESAIIKQNKLDRKKMSVPAFRSQCQDFASRYVDIQREQFKRLGVTGDWEHPYLTMDPAFEAEEVKVFGRMYQKGYIYKGLKPVYWCPKDETALAEAEIEYQDDPCTSIYVKFRVLDDKGLLSPYTDLSRTYFVIWTTTTWTLPGNQAITLNPEESYALVHAREKNETYIVAERLAAVTMEAGGIDDYEIVATLPGARFEYMTAQHPFLPRASLLTMADYVTMDSGTGCVHTAGGFGADDFVTSRRYGINVVVPVDDRGRQTDEAGKFAGLTTTESNTAILADLEASGALFASEEITHSYPHCWRCKSPIIFRATPQWFCSVEAFREKTLDACRKVEWIPAWGGERIAQMAGDRADWCISRQRRWGLPIPVFYCEDCGAPLCDEKTIERVSAIFAREGSNAWYEKPVEQLLPEGYTCPHCGGARFSREEDTLDGWFDSGSSHFAVLRAEAGMPAPADLYLEGADQYRGWFQSSLLTSVGAGSGEAPYRAVLTHGWVVDGEGKAMHKSLGNSILPEEMVAKYGGDLVRLWAASADYQVDVRASDGIFRQLSDAYRKIRNTARILLANLYDFDPNKDLLPPKQLLPIDRWVLARYNRLVGVVRSSFESYTFHQATHEILNFCTVDLSKLYIDITKDRLYVERASSRERRSAQSAMWTILSGLSRLLAPILAFTSDEIWQAMPHRAEENAAHVLLNDLPTQDDALARGADADYDRLFDLREDVMKALEIARAEKRIGKSLEAHVVIFPGSEENRALLTKFAQELPTVFIVSEVTLSEESLTSPEGAPAGDEMTLLTGTPSGISVRVLLAEGCKCGRCWTYVRAGVKTPDGFLCERCAKILSQDFGETR